MKFDKEQIKKAVEDVNLKLFDYDDNLNFKPYYEFSIDDANESIIPSFYNAQNGIHYTDEEYKRNGVCLVIDGDDVKFKKCADIKFNAGIDEALAIEIAEVVTKILDDFEEYKDDHLYSCSKCGKYEYFWDNENLEDKGFVELNFDILCPDCAKEVKQNNLEQNIENFKRFYINAMQEAHEQLIKGSNKYVINPNYESEIQSWFEIELEVVIYKFKEDFENYNDISFYVVGPETLTKIKERNGVCEFYYSIDPDVNGTWSVEELANEGFYIPKN